LEEAPDEAGGTLPVWLILPKLKIHKPADQRELAEAVGFREATLTHHLNAMEARGLITRTRDTASRRIHMVRLTEAGEAAFLRLQQAAIAFDAGPRAGLADADVDVLTELTAAGAAPDPFRYGPRPDHGGALRADPAAVTLCRAAGRPPLQTTGAARHPGGTGPRLGLSRSEPSNQGRAGSAREDKPVPRAAVLAPA